MYNKAIDLNPDIFPAYNNLANLYKEEGRYREAMALYREALRISPGHPVILHNIEELNRSMDERE